MIATIEAELEPNKTGIFCSQGRIPRHIINANPDIRKRVEEEAWIAIAKDFQRVFSDGREYRVKTVAQWIKSEEPHPTDPVMSPMHREDVETYEVRSSVLLANWEDAEIGEYVAADAIEWHGKGTAYFYDGFQFRAQYAPDERKVLYWERIS